MNPITLNDLSANAFRILGLAGDASQEQVIAAARRMRIWPEPSMIPATANDAAWIGPVPRTRRDIEHAVGRLAEPASRLRERLTWFWQTPPTSDAPPALRATAAAGGDVGASHDAALVHLYRCLLLPAAGEHLGAWQATIARFRGLADSDDFLQRLLEVESVGGFEKRATAEEIAEALRRLPLWLSTAVAGSGSE